VKLRWLAGRQGTGYRKLLLAQGSFWDAWLLDYPTGSEIPLHTDPVAGKRHFRVNIVLKRGTGGEFRGETLLRLGRLTVFRPDIAPHSVACVGKRRRVVLSLGWVTR
jgi:hypothetical protein